MWKFFKKINFSRPSASHLRHLHHLIIEQQAAKKKSEVHRNNNNKSDERMCHCTLYIELNLSVCERTYAHTRSLSPAMYPITHFAYIIINNRRHRARARMMTSD